jgi:hypothetical protein
MAAVRDGEELGGWAADSSGGGRAAMHASIPTGEGTLSVGLRKPALIEMLPRYVPRKPG